VLVNAAESEALVTLERLLDAIDAWDPASVRVFYDYDRTCWVGTITFKRVLTNLLEFHLARKGATHPLSCVLRKPTVDQLRVEGSEGLLYQK